MKTKYGTFNEEEFISWNELLRDKAFVVNFLKNTIIGQDLGYIFYDNLIFDKKIKNILCPIDLVGVKKLDLNNVTHIQPNSFENLFVEEFIADNKTYKSIDGVLFDIQNKTLIKFPSEKEIFVYEIPNWCKKIEPNAFSNSKIETLIIPETIKEINDYAFINMFYLKNVYLPDTLEFIGKHAFENCNLDSIKLPEKLKVIEDSAFKGNVLEYLTGNKDLEYIGTQGFASNRLHEVKLDKNTKYEKDSFIENYDIVVK